MTRTFSVRADEIAAYRPQLYRLALLQLRDVIDSLRARAKYVPTPGADDEQNISVFDHLFDGQNCWARPKDVWCDPEAVAERMSFFRVLEACLDRLPPRTSRAFLMREWLDLAPEEIAAELKISAGNLRVLLYRGRMQLRLCLDVGWNRP